MTNTHTHPEPEIAAGHRPISGLGRTKNDLLGQIYCTLSVEKLLLYTPKLLRGKTFVVFMILHSITNIFLRIFGE